MGVIESIFGYMERKKVKTLLEPVKNENEKDKSRKKLNKILEQYPELRAEILNSAKESSQIEDEVVAEAVVENTLNLVNKPEIDEQEKDLLKVGVEFMEKRGEDFADKYIEEVANAAGNSKHIDRNRELNLIGQIDDKEKQQKQITKVLKDIYKRIDMKTTDNNLAEEVNKSIEIVDRCKSINDWERKIVAKQIAYDYIKYGNVFFSSLSKIMPVSKMFNTNLPKTVEIEYNDTLKKIKEENKGEIGKIHKYSQKDFRLRLLDEMAKQIAYQYNETDQIPHINTSEELKKISEEEEKYFIDKIFILSKEELKEDQIENLKGDIRGDNEEVVQIEEVIEMIKEKPLLKRRETIKQVKDIIQNEETSRLIKITKDIGLDKSFEGMDEKDIEARMKIFKQTIDNQREKKENKDKSKNAQNPNIDQEGDDEISL